MTIQPEFMTFFGQKEGGAAFTMGLLRAEMRGLPPPSRSDLAQRYGLSKSQIIQLISVGEEMGLLTVHNGTPAPTETLRSNHAEWIALSLAFLGHHLWPESSLPSHAIAYA